MIFFIVAFISAISFSVLLNVPKNQYLYCGISGTICHLVNKLVLSQGYSDVMASFFATLVLTFVCRFLAIARKMPITIFLIAGIFPLVPGAGIYYTAYYFINDQNILALEEGLETVKIAIGISLGILFVLSLPQWFFNKMVLKKNPKSKKEISNEN